MGWFRTAFIGLAAATSIAGAAHAGELELIYWGEGRLEWFQLDGVSYSVTDDSVDIHAVYSGWHTMSYGAGGSTYSLSVNLSAENAAGTDRWCMDLDRGTFDLLDGASCEEMWEYYYWF